MKTLLKKGEQGQAIIILAMAMIGLLGIVGLALDGGMLYWNQRRAQNGADAAAVAGTTELVNVLTTKGYACGTVYPTSVLTAVNKYASNNEVPNGEVEAYYLTETKNASGVWQTAVATNPGTSGPWQVSATEPIPCLSSGQKVIGLLVKAHYPQRTFIAGVIGIAQTNVTVDAYAIYEYRNWCTDFAMFATDQGTDLNCINVTGSNTEITNGGLHSNCGLHISGSNISLEDDRPIEYGTGAAVNVGSYSGGPSEGVTSVDSYPLPEDAYYRFSDFAPGGFIWNEVASTDRYYVPGDLGLKSGTIYQNNNSSSSFNGVLKKDGTLRDGLYVVEGNVDLNRLSTVRPWAVTIVAKGTVQVSGGIKTLPFVRGLFVYSLSNNSSQGAVKLSGSSNNWAGMVVAPNGDVNVSGAGNNDLSGNIIASRIDFSGSNNEINHRPEYCPYNPPRVLLIN